MTKRVTPATTAIGVITVTLLVAGGSRLLMAAPAAAATSGTISVSPATLPPDGKSLAVVTVTNSACGAVLGAGTATLQSDGSSGFSTSQSGPFLPNLKVPFGSGPSVQAYVQATSTPGLQNLSATFTGGLLSGNCTGQTPYAVLTEVGTPASVVLDAPSPARLMVSTPTTAATITAHVLDASNFPVPGETVFLVRSGDPGNPLKMVDANGTGDYSVNVPPASGPKSETLIAVDATASPNIQSAPQSLVSASSNADCTHTGLKFNPGSIIADGKSSSTVSATFFNGSTAASGEPVTFTGDPGLNVVAGGPTTDGSGVASATVHAGYSIGTKKVTVTDPNSLFSCSGTLTIGNGTPDTQGPGQLSRFIYRAYNDVLHRTGEDAGVEYYGNFVNFGGSRGQVALAFTTTQEYLTNVVQGMYKTILGRGGEPDGVTYWVGQLENGGTTDEQLAALFLSSDEFYANHGNTDSGFLDGLYQVVLGRPADAAGKNSWLAALNNGWTPTQVAYAFTGSTEQLTQKVLKYYSDFLHRSPNSDSDVSYWVTSMQHGVHDENVMAAFIGSQEYFDHS